jgi:hypothetical protein
MKCLLEVTLSAIAICARDQRDHRNEAWRTANPPRAATSAVDEGVD